MVQLPRNFRAKLNILKTIEIKCPSLGTCVISKRQAHAILIDRVPSAAPKPGLQEDRAHHPYCELYESYRLKISPKEEAEEHDKPVSRKKAYLAAVAQKVYLNVLKIACRLVSLDNSLCH